MNLLKMILICSLLIISHSVVAMICVNTTSNYKMFGSVLRASVLKNPFIMAFKDENFKNYKVFYANNDTQLVNQMVNITHDGCSIVLGLFTSQDCLVSGPILKRNKTISVSSSCSDNHIKAYYPYIYTAVPKLGVFSKSVAHYINHASKNVSVYAFYQPSDAYSNFGYEAFKKYVKRPYTAVPVDSSGNFNLKMNASGKSIFVYFTYPLPSAQILVKLNEDHDINKNLTLVGASSWIFDVSVFQPILPLLLKAKAVITPNLVNLHAIESSQFSKKFTQTYHRKPNIVEVLTYDATRLSVECYRKTIQSGKFNNAGFINCIEHNKYKGVSGKFSFEKNSPFSKRKVYLINFLNWVK